MESGGIGIYAEALSKYYAFYPPESIGQDLESTLQDTLGRMRFQKGFDLAKSSKYTRAHFANSLVAFGEIFKIPGTKRLVENEIRLTRSEKADFINGLWSKVESG